MSEHRSSSDRNQAPTTLLDWALAYARDFDWYVLPLIEQGKKPHPCLGRGGGFHHATTDPEQIEKWWTEHPDANVGIACRKSGLIVPDIDSSNGKRGETTWARLIQKHGVAPETVEAVTGSGGRHLVYTVDQDVTPSSLGDHIDLKYNGYIVAPPSIHPDTGRPYRWKDGASPYDREGAVAPTWLLNGSGPESTTTDNGNWLDKVRSTEKGRVLFDEGDISRYENDHSNADFALLNILTAAIGPSPKRVKDAFKRSALWKLDTRPPHHRREDYLDLSIDGVFDRFRNPPDKPHRRPAPTALGQDALYGLVGDWVSLVEEHTEASTAALVAQFLTAVGSALGRGPRFKVEADWHHTNLFAAIVGRTAKARKGTSFGRSVEAIRMADENWNERVHSGISTAEGLVRLLRASKNAVDPTTDENEFKSITDDRDSGLGESLHLRNRQSPRYLSKPKIQERVPRVPLLDDEQVEDALTKWACGQESQEKLATKYGVSQQTLQYHLKKAARAHLNEIIPQMWRFHKQGTPFPICIPAAEAFHENAAFHYGQWLLDQFKKLDMNVIVEPFQDPQSGDIVFGLVDQDFMRELEKGEGS